MASPPAAEGRGSPGVEIGEASLVGAGFVVASDVPSGAVVAGNPARVIKQVAELTCPPGWFERPYTWPPYAEPEAALVRRASLLTLDQRLARAAEQAGVATLEVCT